MPIGLLQSKVAVVVVVGLLPFLLCNCEQPPAPAGCEPACVVREPACAGCPAISDELCVDGACEARGDDSVDLAIDVSIDRDLAGVTALALAIVDARAASCANVGPVAAADGVLAGNRVNVAGGSFHEDLRVGLFPAVDVIVTVDALNDDGSVIASGCEALGGGVVDVLVNVVP